MNNHFGIVLASITAVVIGGAFVLDQFTDKSTTEPKAAATPVKSEAKVADTNGDGSTTTLADAGKEASIPSAPVDSRPQAAAPAKSVEPPKKVATATLTPKASAPVATATKPTVRAPVPVRNPAPAATSAAPARAVTVPAPIETATAAPAQPVTVPAPIETATAAPAQTATAPASIEPAPATPSPSIASGDTAPKTDAQGQEARKAE